MCLARLLRVFVFDHVLVLAGLAENFQDEYFVDFIDIWDDWQGFIFLLFLFFLEFFSFLRGQLAHHDFLFYWFLDGNFLLLLFFFFTA